MAYKVVILPKTQMRLERYIAYTKDVLKNPTAAKNIAMDARNTKKRLATIAPTLALCTDEELASLGYRTIHFLFHVF
ncbi:MAG: type II toxin-antitoxin system RelE/ParE family toxin [Lachnospiraceae bacterium]|nr:type II toxin-antitoxin system RelE/ParE family toxin [Lachnospiraceae bacterium]